MTRSTSRVAACALMSVLLLISHSTARPLQQPQQHSARSLLDQEPAKPPATPAAATAKPAAAATPATDKAPAATPAKAAAAAATPATNSAKPAAAPAKAAGAASDAKPAATANSKESSTQSAADVADQQMRLQLGSDDPTLLPQRSFGKRVDGTGRLGTVSQVLLGRLNDLADRVPRVGAETDVRTAARGNRTAERRANDVTLQTLPLQGRASGTGGAAAVDNDIAISSVDTTGTAVAKDIADQSGTHPVDLGGISRVQGITATRGRPGRPGGSQTLGTAFGDAGEGSGLTSERSVFDGSLATNSASQRGIGDQVSTRLQIGNLATAAHTPDGGPTNSGGSVLYAQADTTDLDDDEYSVTNPDTFGKKFNTQATMSGDSRANRHKYTAGTSTGTMTAVGSKDAYAGIEGGQFGTGFQSGTTTVRASTPLVYSRDN